MKLLKLQEVNKVIGIDTNILVRYLTQDDLEQAQIVEQVFDAYLTSQNSIFINNIVLCELVWVLERGYKYNRETIGNVLKQIFSTKEFAFENHKILWLALDQYTQDKLDFSDALIGLINKEVGCIKIITLDQNAARADTFILATENKEINVL